eukprot:4423991-Amphidinium_carterae.1
MQGPADFVARQGPVQDRALASGFGHRAPHPRKHIVAVLLLQTECEARGVASGLLSVHSSASNILVPSLC